MKQTGALINLLLLTLCTTLASAQQTHITFAYNRAWLTFTGIDNWEFKPVQVGDKFGFSTGLATGAWGITKPSGEVEISPLFDKVCRFEKGFAAVKNRGYWGVINTSAEYVVEPDFDKVWSPQNNKDTEELVMRFSGDGVDLMIFTSQTLSKTGQTASTPGFFRCRKMSAGICSTAVGTRSVT